MASTPMTSAADQLIKAADKSAERTTKSSLDTTFGNFQLPSDPNKLGQLYGGVANNLMDELDIRGALNRSNDLSSKSGIASAASVFENRIKREELSNTPISELDKEIDRLSNQRWGVLPAVLGRSDIIDYGAKLKIASHAETIIDDEIGRLTHSREQIVHAAEGRAKDRTEQLKAQAELLDKQSTAAKNDLTARIDLFKEGRATFDDIVQAALKLKKLNDDKSSAGSGGGNPFLGMASDGGFNQADIASFAYFEKFGDFPVADTSKLQLKAGLTQRYAAWVQAGRPGAKIQVPGKPLPAGAFGPPNPSQSVDVSTLFNAPSSARQSGVWALLGGAAPASGAGGGSNLPNPNGEVGNYYTP